MEAALTLIRAPFRRAEQADASLLAELVNYAGEGLPHYLWGKLTRAGETAWDVGRRRAAREDGSFSYRNAILREPRAIYVVCERLAVRPQFRGKGLGTELLRLADETGRALGKRGMSVIVSDRNTGARRLYERCGYGAVAARAMVKDGWVNDGNNWVLLTKQL
jgi:GNAT superfamily N-acetyltransferase